MNIVDLLILWIGAAGWTLVLCNKLPSSWYDGDGFFSRMIQCELCTGTEVGWASYFLWAWLSGARVVPLFFLEWAMFGPACGLLALTIQKIGQATLELRKLARGSR